MARKVTRLRLIRQLMQKLLKTSSDFEAFCIDYFPQVSRYFTSGMDRTKQENLLLERISPSSLIEALIQSNPEEASRTAESLGLSREELLSESRVEDNRLGTLPNSQATTIGDELILGGVKLDEECEALRAGSYAEIIAKLLRRARGEVCFALFGHWGRGKTFLAKQIAEKAAKKNYACVWFSAWRYRSRPELWVYLYETMRQTFSREFFLLRLPMVFRGRWADEGVSGVILLLLALALAFIPIGIKWALLVKGGKLLVPLLGIVGLFRLVSALWKQWASLSSFFTRYMTTARHGDKLGLQAALGEDLKRLLWGWLGGPRKDLPMRFGALIAYCLAAAALVCSLWLALAPGEPVEGTAVPWVQSFLESKQIRIHPDGETRLKVVEWTGGILAVLPLWLLGLVPMWQFIRWRKVGERRVLLIVDDLDRMAEEEMLDVIEQLKLFLEHESLKERLQILMVCEEDALRTAISKKYNRLLAPRPDLDAASDQGGVKTAHMVAESTLQKLFVASLRLPPLSLREQHQFLATVVSPIKQEQKTAAGVPPFVSDVVVNVDPPALSASSIIPATPQRSPGTELTEDESTALHNALDILGNDNSAWTPLGPRAIASFVFRYKLARQLLEARGAAVSPYELAQQLSLRLAYPDKELVPDAQIQAVLDEVA